MFKWTVGALSALHKGTEARIITILEKANLAAIHAGRVTLMAKDIELAIKLSDATEHYKTTKSVTEVESVQQQKETENRHKEEIKNLKKKKQPQVVSEEKQKETHKKQAQGKSGEGVVDSDDSDEEIIIRCSTKRKQLSSSDSESDDVPVGTRSVRCSKKLTKEQYDYFEQEQSFTDELITIVIEDGWDKVDIENFVLLYNHVNGKHIPLPDFHRKKETYVNKANKSKNEGNSKSVKTKWQQVNEKDREKEIRKQSGEVDAGKQKDVGKTKKSGEVDVGKKKDVGKSESVSTKGGKQKKGVKLGGKSNEKDKSVKKEAKMKRIQHRNL